MKTFNFPFYALTAILLVGLTTSTVAQDRYFQDEAEMHAHMEQIRRENQQRIEAHQAAMRAAQRSPAMQQMQRNALRQMMNSFWEGEGSMLMTMGLLQQDDFREGIGVSDEQWQNIMRAPSDVYNSHPDLIQYRDEMTKLMEESGGLFGENATEETLNRHVELQMQMQTKMQEVIMERMTDAVNENLTPDQIQKIKEAQISVMSEIPIISASMFEALDLSDAQRRQLDEIKREMQPEFEKHADKMADAHMKFMEKMQEAMERMYEITDPEERSRFIQNLSENIRRTNPDIQRAMNEVMESGRVFSEALRIRMFDVLTDAQWRRMTNLVDNPPEYMKRMIAEMRRQMGTDDPQAVSRQPGGGWVPGPDAWRPGDAIPEGYRIERETRRSGFPRSE